MRRLAQTLVCALAISACASPAAAPRSVPQPILFVTSELEPVSSDRVTVRDVALERGQGEAVHVAMQMLPRDLQQRRSELLASFRTTAGARGANVIVIQPQPNGAEKWTAYFIAAQALRNAARTSERANLSRDSTRTAGLPDSAKAVSPTTTPGATGSTVTRTTGSSTTGSSARGCVGQCSVRVKGYTRKDGTYVKPHTRNRPGTKSGGRRRP